MLSTEVPFLKILVLTGYLIWFAGSVADFIQTVTGKNVNKTSSGESSLTGIGQREIKDNKVETSAECFDNC